MNWKLLFIAPAFFALASCLKSNGCPEITTVAPKAETDSLNAYLQANSITATLDQRGFFYAIQNAGSSDKPQSCDNVSVNYIGRLTNGAIFDQANGASLPLGQVITGWREGIPLIGKGGKMILYLPPSLAYGAQGRGTIPANSILIFNIDLVNFTRIN